MNALPNELLSLVMPLFATGSPQQLEVRAADHFALGDSLRASADRILGATDGLGQANHEAGIEKFIQSAAGPGGEADALLARADEAYRTGGALKLWGHSIPILQLAAFGLVATAALALVNPGIAAARLAVQHAAVVSLRKKVARGVLDVLKKQLLDTNRMGMFGRGSRADRKFVKDEAAFQKTLTDGRVRDAQAKGRKAAKDGGDPAGRHVKAAKLGRTLDLQQQLQAARARGDTQVAKGIERALKDRRLK
ncbi:hypothetical protein GCM10022226_73520 [Sphaerisporangium flaviroseum]|uniref:Uncharacterized protein n=1 Tax=Sphaerisporangium flaviroseum TaxID=509199 RepID=A0ABP7JBB8_9ACTN